MEQNEQTNVLLLAILLTLLGMGYVVIDAAKGAAVAIVVFSILGMIVLAIHRTIIRPLNAWRIRRGEIAHQKTIERYRARLPVHQ